MKEAPGVYDTNTTLGCHISYIDMTIIPDSAKLNILTTTRTDFFLS